MWDEVAAGADIDAERSFAWAGDNAVAIATARDRFNFFTTRAAEVRLPPLPYGTQRDVVVWRDARGKAQAAALCDGAHGVRGVYPAAVPLQDVIRMTLAFPARPDTPTCSRLRRTIGFPKKVGVNENLVPAM